MEQLASASTSTCSYLTDKIDLLTDTRQLLSALPIEKFDPGLVYIAWLQSYGVKISTMSVSYARYLRQETLSKPQYQAHQRRISYLKRMQQRAQEFPHYTRSEADDGDSSWTISTSPSLNNSWSGASDTNLSSAERSMENEDKSAEDEDWLLVIPVELRPQVDEAVLDELEAHMGGMGLAIRQQIKVQPRQTKLNYCKAFRKVDKNEGMSVESTRHRRTGNFQQGPWNFSTKHAKTTSTNRTRAFSFAKSIQYMMDSHVTKPAVASALPKHLDCVCINPQAFFDHYHHEAAAQEIPYIAAPVSIGTLSAGDRAGCVSADPRVEALSSDLESRKDDGRPYVKIFVRQALRGILLPLWVRIDWLGAEWRRCHSGTHVEVKNDRCDLIVYFKGADSISQPAVGLEGGKDCDSGNGVKATASSEGQRTMENATAKHREKLQAKYLERQKEHQHVMRSQSIGRQRQVAKMDAAIEESKWAQDVERQQATPDSTNRQDPETQAQAGKETKAASDTMKIAAKTENADQQDAAEAQIINRKARIIGYVKKTDGEVQKLCNELMAIDLAEDANKKSWWQDRNAASKYAARKRAVLARLTQATRTAEELREKLIVIETVEDARRAREMMNVEGQTQGIVDVQDGWELLEDDSGLDPIVLNFESERQQKEDEYILM